jgi:hypothetical protein
MNSMKKLMAGLFVASLASTAMATASFDFGSIFYFPRYDSNAGDNFSGQGQSFSANWDLDNDLIVGAYTESTDLSDQNGNTYPFTVNAITVAKGVVKNASIGLHLGTFYNDVYNDDYTGMLTDLFGNVTLMAGSADKVSGSLKASFGGRFARENENGGDYDFSGYFVALSVGIGI